MIQDKENMINVLDAFSEQCKDAVKIAKGIKVKGKIDNVIFCGMGGSGVVGDIAAEFVSKIPFYIVHDYELPKAANKNSLIFLVSYSGNTEETLSCYKQAKSKKAKIVSITSGGKLSSLDKKAIIIPKGFQPRVALGYLLMPILVVLANSKVIVNPGINQALEVLDSKICSRKGFLLAKEIKGRLPIFYASNSLKTAAYRCKTQINENSKQPAFNNVLPEMNHNEINGFYKNSNKIHAVFIRDKKDSEMVKKRMDISKVIIKEKTKVSEIHSFGNNLLGRILSVIYIGDYASYYLALMNKEDPTPVPVIEVLKKKLVK